MADKIRVLIVDDLPETRENVRKLLQFEPDLEVIGHAATGEQAIELARQQRPDIILMDINMPGVDGIGASQAIARYVPTCQIIIMSVQSESDYLRRAMMAGARDFLMKPFSGDELVTAIRRVYETRPPVTVPVHSAPTTTAAVGGKVAQAAQEGNLVVVFSPKGGSGCTTLAVNLAVSFAQNGHRTVIVDGSLQFGDVAVMLNLKTISTIIDLIDRISELDTDLISSVVQNHSSGLKVLLAPPRPEMAELVTEEHMRTLLKRLRQEFDIVIVDTSSSLSDVTLAVLDMADRIILVTQQNLPGLKNVSRFFDLSTELNYEQRKMMLVVNRASPKLNISVKDIADTLKRPVAMTIPADDIAAGEAADQGKPMVSGHWQKRPIAASFAKLASHVVEDLKVQPEDEARDEMAGRSRLARLFGGR